MPNGRLATPPRWTTAEVLALAPDAAVAHAARGLATPSAWSGLGSDDVGVWGVYRGTSAEPYDVVVDRRGPAWRCSCPSRKIPCKHAIALTLLWAEGNVPTTVRPAHAATWLAGRSERPQGAATSADGVEGAIQGSPAGDSSPSVTAVTARPTDRERERRIDERAARVRAGLEELDRWLADQVRHGLTAASLARVETWEAVAARLVDAQAGALANRVHRVKELVGAGVGWHERVLGEMANLHALAVAGCRTPALDEDLAVSVRTAVGWAIAKEEVLAGTPVTDRWHVVARSDTEEHRITVRRTWLLGGETGRWALLLSFAAFGQTLDRFPPLGSVMHADVHHFPGRIPIRALVGVQHEPPADDPVGPPASTVAGSLAEAGWALACEPWLERWPGVVLARPARSAAPGGWSLLDDSGALPLAAGPAIVTLLAASGGRPVVVGGEHTAAGFVPLSVRLHDRAAVLT